jgi:hypothetical protein
MSSIPMYPRFVNLVVLNQTLTHQPTSAT